MTLLSYYPHHDGSPLYCSATNPALGETLKLRVSVHSSWQVSRILLRQSDSGEAFLKVAKLVSETGSWNWYEAELDMTNPVVGYRWFIELIDGESYWLNAVGLNSLDRPDSEDFRISIGQKPPEWATGGVMYQVFPDRFARGAEAGSREIPIWANQADWSDEVIGEGPGTAEQLFGGDLDGVREKLDYLIELGVDVLYLTPFFPARSNHRYDASSFDTVDPLLGGDRALENLVEQAHNKGLRVIGDLTSNHSGSAHEWFNTALQDPQSEERGFYYFHENGDYESWFGVPSLPKFNWASTELRERFVRGENSVVAKWMKKPYSLDGWRIDVANMTGRFRDQDMFAEIGSEIRQRMNEVNPDSFLMAEYTSDASMQINGQSWQGAMTYSNFSKPILRWLARAEAETEKTHLGPGHLEISAKDFVQTYQSFIAAFPWTVRLHNMNALDTHDTPRFKTLSMPGAQRVAATVQFTIPGMPTIFAGDELGLTGWNGENSRTPMPWDGERETEPALTDVYKKLIELRTSHPTLSNGAMRWLHANEESMLFARESEAETLLIAVSRGADSIVIPRDSAIHSGRPESLFGGKEMKEEGDSFRVQLGSTDAQIWRIRD